mgnify:CR=1 FL=1
MISIELQADKKIYFASDQHLGLPDYAPSRKREKLFIQWLDTIKADAQVIFLLGDLFDFWFEYEKVVPKYFVRTLGKLAELADSGIRIVFFTGNHDMWMGNYLEEEIGMEVYFERQEFMINDKLFFIAHGDGLGPDDHNYKRLKRVFKNPFFNFCYRWLHPDIGVRIGEYLSRKNKMISGDEDVKFEGEDKEWLILYAKRKLQEKHYDYFIFGHRHLPLIIDLGNSSKYYNTGDWIDYYSYLEMGVDYIDLKYFKHLISG